ncbi:MAG: trigger factor [Firmicutes bacterium]|nr:trigger factor [Bacillota bacterium]
MTSALVSKENIAVKISLTFTGEEFDAATAKVFQQQRGRITVNGFRKGKAPRSIIEKMYGEGIFFSDAIDDLVNEAYPKALEELGIEPVGFPSLELGDEPLHKGQGFVATITIPVAPTVEVKDYKGVKVERTVKHITEADVAKELEAEQKKNAVMASTDKAAELNDTVLFDYKGFVGDEQFEGGTADGASLKLGSGQFIPGFEDQLVGTTAGTDKDVVVTFPENYPAENLAGKEAVFHCHIHEVKTENLPELNDQFAVDYTDFETLDAYKADVQKKLEEAAAGAAEYEGKNAVITKVVEANEAFDVPEDMVNNEVENMFQEMKQNMAQQGIDMKMYCQILNTSEAQIKEGMKEDALKRVKTRLIVLAVAKAEGLEATEEDMENELKAMAEQYAIELEQFKTMFGEENKKYLKEDILSRKAIDVMYQNAEFTEVEDAPAADETK